MHNRYLVMIHVEHAYLFDISQACLWFHVYVGRNRRATAVVETELYSTLRFAADSLALNRDH